MWNGHSVETSPLQVTPPPASHQQQVSSSPPCSPSGFSRDRGNISLTDHYSQVVWLLLRLASFCRCPPPRLTDQNDPVAPLPPVTDVKKRRMKSCPSPVDRQVSDLCQRITSLLCGTWSAGEQRGARGPSGNVHRTELPVEEQPTQTQAGFL